MSYEITFVGTSGGPLEHGTCSILVKPACLSYSLVLQSRDKPLFMIDGGSGWHALAEIIRKSISEDSGQNKPCSCSQLALYRDLQSGEYLRTPVSLPFLDLTEAPAMALRRILAKVDALLLSHPHMDHVQALVLNLAGATEPGDKTVIYASGFTTDALHTHVFNGLIWPDLVLLGFLALESVPDRGVFEIASGAYTVTHFEVSHGQVVNKGRHMGPYKSLAFLVCDKKDQAKMLVFGDFEADVVLRLERNAMVWLHAAPYVLDGSLKCVILECSTHSREPGAHLYGHMTPQHVIAEFQRLEALCGEIDVEGAAPHVRGLNVIITHVKETYDGRDPRRRIMRELSELNAAQGLRLNISIATNGVLVVV